MFGWFVLVVVIVVSVLVAVSCVRVNSRTFQPPVRVDIRVEVEDA